MRDLSFYVHHIKDEFTDFKHIFQQKVGKYKHIWTDVLLEAKTVKNHPKLKACSSLLSSSLLLPANKGCYSQKVKRFLLLFKRLWSVWHTNGRQITSLQTRLGPSAWSATCNTASPWGLLTLLPFTFAFPLSLLLLPLPPILTPLPLLFAVLKHLSADVFWALEHPGALRSRQREKNKEPLQCPRCRSYLALPLGRNT